MRPIDKIDLLIKNLKTSASPELDRRIDDLIVQSQMNNTGKLKSWSNFMRKTYKYAAAAIVVIALGLFMHFQNIPLDGTAKAYGMSDVPRLFHSARSLHIKGKMFFPEYKNSEPVEIEHWIDAENNRWRSIRPSYVASGGTLDVYLTEEIFDGRNTIIFIDHREKTYTHFHVSVFQRNLSIHRTIEGMMQLIFGQPEMFDSYRIRRQELIDGEVYNLWEGIADFVPMKLKMQSWLSPHTGQMAKAFIWQSENGKKWLKQCEFDTVEMNVPIADSVFQIEDLTGFTALNTIESAKNLDSYPRISGGLSNVYLQLYFLFALPDNSLLMCWRNELLEDREQESQYFEGLYFGSPAPQLPAEVYALKTTINSQEYLWHGKHLTATQKNGKYYEWAVYIPEQTPPKKLKHVYTLVYRMNDGTKANVTLSLGADVAIENQEDFEKFVIGAMKELSDDPALPIDITLEQVMDLMDRH